MTRFGAAVLLLVLIGASAQAPQPGDAPIPTLTPVAARDVADACPNTASFASALVRGASAGEAASARAAFAACASQTRLPGFEWKTEAASLALGAADLTLGIRNNDAAALRRAADETSGLRSLSVARDDEVRTWTTIPDFLDPHTRLPASLGYVPIVPGESLESRPPYRRDASIVTAAAYVNLAARLGIAWIHEPSPS
jgi:hypothetical protein